MIDILTGIRNAWRSDSTLSNAVNGMYFEIAPKNVSMPYITYHMTTNTPSWDFGVTTYENPSIQFNIYSDKENSPSEACQIYSDLIILYDSATLTMTDHSQIMFQRGTSVLTRLGDEPVWLYTCDYNSMMEET